MTKPDSPPYIALALSGGGARAMAFHLGCFRALYDRGILDQVRVMSSVSGGSVFAACWAYRGEDFGAFEKHMIGVLSRGIRGDILREVFRSPVGLKIIATLVITGIPSVVIWLLTFAISRARLLLGLPTMALERALQVCSRSLPIWGSLTTAFEAALARQFFGDTTVDQVKRPGLTMIINACDLTTGTAFRFGSSRSGGWRYGDVVGAPLPVAKAVTASAAFPILLPPLIETFVFEKKGERHEHTVALTDGGVFDNLGVAVLEPGRAHDHAYIDNVTHLISLNAGGGQLDIGALPYWWAGRVARSFEAVHRKAQDAVYQRLHKYVEASDLRAFGMVYLGQQDSKLPWKPVDLVTREQVKDYPTDFSPMSEENLELLSKRGEQLTHIIVERYLAEIAQ